MDWILSFFTGSDPWILLALFLLGVGGFIFSTLAGGGGALVLLPLVNTLLGAQYTAPVLNLGNLIGRPARLFLYWKHIHWRICAFYVVPALLGAWAGAWMFGQLKIEFLQLLIGGFLVSTLFQYRMGRRARSFSMPDAGFAPLGFVISFLGTLVGAMGPVLNPFYMNAGLEKEELIGTKTANSFFMGLGQLSGYSFFGLLEGVYWGYGIALGAGAILGNILGKKILSRITVSGFRILLLLFMVLSGGMLIYSALFSLLG
ncbi:sulfite exporter TauE/SafE family protein [Robiginitalea sp.]|uniref:sulfite exporter TauE/SafE family protein n=1 Tax=Robiginitalea sp. TaxID=1902411 RepID=UPI003C73BB64